MAGEERGWLQRFIIWREKNVKEKRFILVLSFLVGIFTAFAALILKMLIHWIQNFLTENFDTTEANYQYLIYPVVGIFLAGLFVRYVVKDDISHGVQTAMGLRKFYMPYPAGRDVSNGIIRGRPLSPVP